MIHKKINIVIVCTLFLFLVFVVIASFTLLNSSKIANESKAAVLTDNFVRTNGTQFVLNGNEFKYVGFNLFDLAGTTDIYNCTQGGAWSDADLDKDLSYLKNTLGVKVLRMWAFQTYTKGGTDYRGMDRAIAFAKKYDMKLIVALEDGPGYCTDANPAKKYSGDAKWKQDLWSYQDPTTGVVTKGWYNNAYNRNYKYSGYSISFPDYIDKIVPHYANEPTIMSWQVMNEAEANDVHFYDFAKAMTSQVKKLAPNQLITLGSQSSGQGGTLGADFIKVYSLPSIDYAEGHDYAYWGGDDKPLPGSSDGKTLPNATTCTNDHAIACSISQSLRTLNKPFLIGESGIIAQGKTTFEGKRWTNDQRSTMLKAKMDVAFNNGVGGYLLWEWNKVVDQGHDFLNPSRGATYNDPLYTTITNYNNTFNKIILTPTTNNTNTPTPIANTSCLCDVNLCSNICTFNKAVNVTYFSPMSCAVETGVPSQDDKNKYCNRIERTKGDADGDGKVNNLDYIYYIRVVNGGKVPGDINPDFDGNGKVSPNDLTIVSKNMTR